VNTKTSTITTTSHHISFRTDTGIGIDATIVIADRGRIDSCVIRGGDEWHAFNLNLDLDASRPIYQFPARAVCSAASSYRALDRIAYQPHDTLVPEALDFVLESIRTGISTLLVEMSFLCGEQTNRTNAQSMGYALRECIIANCTVEITTTFKSI
jgi:hypothetical protein